MTIFIIVILALAGFLLLANPTGSDIPAPPSPQVGAVAQAIAKAENSNPDWNNPGSLTISFGYPTSGVGNSAGVLIFNSAVDGWNALYKQLEAIIHGQSRYTLDTTITSFGLGYSGGDPNWAINVASALGVSPDTQLGDILA